MATFLFTACQTQQEKQEKQGPYNVLFIAIDDLRTELNCYGAEHIKSPNIDRLAASGVRFTNAHVQQAICMASRASIMSGIRPEKHGIYTGESVEDMMPNVLTLNKFFKQNGYTISACGKIYHHSEDIKSQFGAEYMEPVQTWTGRGYVSEKAIKIRELDEDNAGPAYEYADVKDEAYKDGANTLLAINKLKELKEGGKPFFMAYLSLTCHLLPPKNTGTCTRKNRLS